MLKKSTYQANNDCELTHQFDALPKTQKRKENQWTRIKIFTN
nr:MAG TPA: hypothetical protein [Caudoviricetes sp.]